MTSLLDIGPLTSTIEIRGKKIELRGISGKVLFHLLDDFPELRKVMSGAKTELKAEDLIKQVPGAISTMIAAACAPKYSNLAAEEREKLVAAAETLNLGEQADVLMKVWELTFPSGTQSFTTALEAINRVTGSGWAPDTPSPGPSPTSSKPGTQKPLTTPPG